MKLCLRPRPSEIHPTNGIGRVLGAQYRYLPKLGFEIAEDDKADLYIGHTTQGNMLRIDILQCHGMYWLGDKDSGDYGSFHMHANDAIIESARKAKAITVPSNWVGECFRRDMRIEPHVIGHGIDFAEWEPSKERGGYVLYAKNRVFDVCYPDAPYEMAKRGLPVVSTFAPDGVVVPNSLQVIGRQNSESMKKWLREADVYLATTKETFGIQTLEAMACAVPVVGWNYGGTADIVTSGYDGILVKPGDYDALFNACNEAYAKRAIIGAHARETAARYDWANVMEQYAKLFEDTYKSLQEERHGVSVVITTHNYAHYVFEAVESALAQTAKPAEVIVIDDGSTDNTLEVLAKYRQCKVIAQENRGVAAARTVGIEAATQPYIICLDADDKLDSRYIETMLPVIDGARDIGVVYSNLTLFTDDGEAHESSGFPPAFDWEAQANPGNPPSNCIPSAAMFRREMWRRAGPHKQEYAPGEDAEFWTRSLSVGFKAVKVSGEGLIWYRMHGESASRRLKYKQIDDRLPWMRDKRYPLAAPSKYAPLVMSYSEPKVSIVVVLDNQTARKLPDTIDSILGQTMREWELITVESGSGSVFFERYPFIRYEAIGGGLSYTLKAGLDMARAPLVMFMHAGDMLTNSALEEMLTAHVNNGGRYVYTDMLNMSANGDVKEVMTQNYRQAIWRAPLHGAALIPTIWARKVGFKAGSRAPLNDFYSRLAIGGCCGQRLGRALFINRSANEKLSTKRIKELESIKMTGCCGGNGDALLAAKAALAGMINNPVEVGKVRLEYIGDNVGAITFFGKGTGRQYQGGRNEIEGFVDADESDIDFLLATGKWARAKNVIQLAPPVEEKPAPKVEPVKAAPVVEAVAEKVLPIDDEMTPEQEETLNAQINEQIETQRKMVATDDRYPPRLKEWADKELEKQKRPEEKQRKARAKKKAA